MTILRLISFAALVSLPGTIVEVYGQQEKQDKPQQRQQDQRPMQPAQPHQQQQPDRRAQQPQQQQQQDRRAQQPQQQQQQDRRAQQSQQQQQQDRRAQQPQQQQQQGRRAQQPQQQQRQQQRAQYEQPAQHGNPAGLNRSYAPPQRDRQQVQTWQQQSGWRQGGWQGQASWQQDRSSHWQSEHRTWGQRGGYGGYYIPQDRFSLYFGLGHWFRIRSQPIIVSGYPRFQYGGYTFMMVDPWPEDWASDWYAADDVYVGYDNGYYLYNRMHPYEAIAITVVL